jgi:hypothetical protein
MINGMCWDQAETKHAGAHSKVARIFRLNGFIMHSRLPVALICLAFLGAPVHADPLSDSLNANPGQQEPETETDLQNSETDTALQEPVRRFLEAFIDPQQSPEAQSLFFTEGVQYYRFGPTSRREIIKDIRRYSRHWPNRSYTLARIEYIRPDPDSGDIFVSYVLDYEVANGPKRARGTANYGAIITNLQSDPQISMIMEKVGGSQSSGK